MRSGGATEYLVLAHQLTGYLTAFVIAPMAMSAFAVPARHRVWARIYLCLMVPLYLTGLTFTFRLNEFGSFVWARNLAFNFTGFFFLLLGWRAIVRYRRQIVEPAPLDHAMRGLLLAGSATMVLLGVLHHFGSFVLGSLGLWLGLVVFRESGDVRALYVKHQRCMLTSYFYLLTVLSLVHVKASTDIKWLWPALLGVPLVVYATRGGPDPRRVRVAVRTTVAIALLLAVYIAVFSPPEFHRA